MDDKTIELNNRKCYRILLAEDYEVSQKLTRLILQKAGYYVDGVINGQQAVEAYKKNHYDCLPVLMEQFLALRALKVISSLDQDF